MTVELIQTRIKDIQLWNSAADLGSSFDLQQNVQIGHTEDPSIFPILLTFSVSPSGNTKEMLFACTMEGFFKIHEGPFEDNALDAYAIMHAKLQDFMNQISLHAKIPVFMFPYNRKIEFTGQDPMI